MTRKSRREIEREIERLKRRDEATDTGSGVAIGFEDPDTGGLLDSDGDPIENADTAHVVFSIPYSVWREWDASKFDSHPHPQAAGEGAEK